MKLMGRKHRPYYRIVAIDGRQPRDGRVIEELGSYDPMVKNTDERVKMKLERVDYWTGVGAQPSENVAVLVKKYRKKMHKQAAAQTPTTDRLIAMRFDVLTLFPEIFQGYLTQSLLNLAIQSGLSRDSPVEHPRLGAGQAQER